jgi:FeS assembly protein SufD
VDPARAIVEEPISVVFVSTSPGTAQVTYARVLVVAGDNSQARIVETYVGPPGHEYFTNAVTEVVVGPGAVIDHYKVERESRRGFHLAGMHVDVARAGVFSSHSTSFGGMLVRNEVVAVLGGEGADCTLNGLYLANGRRHVDNRTTIDHAKPHFGSHELYKGVLGGHARAVFNGRIVVRPDAQKTDAKQTNKALLLSDEAQINTKPQLEICANDVKCTHGAAVGQLDEDAVFYLRARGLDRQQARDMLIHAFASDVLDRIRIVALIKLTDVGASSGDPAPATEHTESTREVFAHRHAEKTREMEPKIIQTLSTIFDPEIPVNIYELGLVYEMAVDADDVVAVRMTLTAPGCPAAQSLPVEVVDKLKQLPGVADARVEIVWDPPWTRDRMSDAARLQLRLF